MHAFIAVKISVCTCVPLLAELFRAVHVSAHLVMMPCRFFQIEGESGTPRQRKRGPADSDEDEQPSDAEEAGPDFAAQHRAARSRARKRARRAPSPSLSPFEDEEEPEDDLGPEQGRECADDSQQPSPELPTDGWVLHTAAGFWLASLDQHCQGHPSHSVCTPRICTIQDMQTKCMLYYWL